MKKFKSGGMFEDFVPYNTFQKVEQKGKIGTSKGLGSGRVDRKKVEGVPGECA